MKRNELVDVTTFLKKFQKISAASRVEDNIVKIVFDRSFTVFVDLTKGDSHLFMKDDFKRAKNYNAPFDVLLNKRFANAHIQGFEVVRANRILRIKTALNSSYKSSLTTLQLEFTGRNTNCIILDENEIVLEALRHIDSHVSSRSVKVAERLEPLAPREFNEPPSRVEDVEKFLCEEFQLRSKKRLLHVKNQKLLLVQKKIDKLQQKLDKLEEEKVFEEKANTYSLWGTLVLSNLEKIKDYQKEVFLTDFEGQKVHIIFPKEAKTPTHGANLLFHESKKLKKKVKSLYIERENLQTKRDFFKKLQMLINKSDDENELNILLPKQKKTKKDRSEQKNYETFFLNGFKIMLGKNEKGNVILLKEAKKSDIWMHLKGIPSSHVIIKTDKQNIPQDIIDFAAKLCVEFSIDKVGTYLVDYTQRRNVKVVDGANVTYVNYKTLHFEE
jgi:predicted ribosome quality control (RQC) complex YloA/Tae2 family protein